MKKLGCGGDEVGVQGLGDGEQEEEVEDIGMQLEGEGWAG